MSPGAAWLCQAVAAGWSQRRASPGGGGVTDTVLLSQLKRAPGSWGPASPALRQYRPWGLSLIKTKITFSGLQLWETTCEATVLKTCSAAGVGTWVTLPSSRSQMFPFSTPGFAVGASLRAQLSPAGPGGLPGAPAPACLPALAVEWGASTRTSCEGTKPEPTELCPAEGLGGWESPRTGLLALSAGFQPSQLLGFGGEGTLVCKVGL